MVTFTSIKEDFKDFCQKSSDVTSEHFQLKFPKKRSDIGHTWPFSNTKLSNGRRGKEFFRHWDGGWYSSFWSPHIILKHRKNCETALALGIPGIPGLDCEILLRS